VDGGSISESRREVPRPVTGGRRPMSRSVTTSRSLLRPAVPMGPAGSGPVGRARAPVTRPPPSTRPARRRVVHGGVARTRVNCPGGRRADLHRNPRKHGERRRGDRGCGICALNALAVLEVELGTLDRVERVLTVTGYVASTPDFHRQPDVVDGASAVLSGCSSGRPAHPFSHRRSALPRAERWRSK